MTGYVADIEKLTEENQNFRQVLFTSQHVQVVVMHLQPKESIGVEVHEVVDQFLRIEHGEGVVIMNDQEHSIKSGYAIVVPAGTKHNVINTSSTESLNLYTVYSPPHHKDKIIHKTKQASQSDTTDHI